MNALDFPIIILYFITGFCFIFFRTNNLSDKHKFYLRLILAYQFLFGVFFYLYTSDGGVDSYTYWMSAKEFKIDSFSEILDFNFGTNFVVLLNYIPSRILGLTYFQGTLLYTFIGYLGFFYLYKTIITLLHNIPKVFGINLFPLLLFLPNMHFWSAGVGKDTIVFACICIALYSLIKKRYIYIFISFALIYLIRPHIVFFIIISFFIVFIVDKKINRHKRFFLIILFFLILALMFSKIMAFLNIESLGLDSIESYTENKVKGLSRDYSGSRVDISNYNFVYKIFTFMFRPLFYDITNLMSIIVSFENLFLLFLTWKIFRAKILRTFINTRYEVKVFFVFLVISMIGFSLILGNLGIMIRMKNMLMPSFIIFVLISLKMKKKRKDLISDNK